MKFTSPRDLTQLVNRWMVRFVVLVILFMTPNLLYANLLHMSRPSEVVPAASLPVAERFLTGGERERLVQHMVEEMYVDITRYVQQKRSQGNILHSLTLGILDRDVVTAAYVERHITGLTREVIPVIFSRGAQVDIVSIIRSDLEQAMTTYAQALDSRNPFRLSKMVEAEKILRELSFIIQGKVGERCHGVTLTWQVLQSK